MITARVELLEVSGLKGFADRFMTYSDVKIINKPAYDIYDIWTNGPTARRIALKLAIGSDNLDAMYTVRNPEKNVITVAIYQKGNRVYSFKYYTNVENDVIRYKKLINTPLLEVINKDYDN